MPNSSATGLSATKSYVSSVTLSVREATSSRIWPVSLQNWQAMVWVKKSSLTGLFREWAR